MRKTRVWLVVLMAVVLAETRFIAHPVTDGLTGGYQVIIADMDHDGKPDLMALASFQGIGLVWLRLEILMPGPDFEATKPVTFFPPCDASFSPPRASRLPRGTAYRPRTLYV
jgi:hypothetical protein